MIKRILSCVVAVIVLFISSCPSPLPAANIRITLSVAYDANGGTGIMTSDSVMHGDDYTIKTNSFNRDDYFFVGWNTAADGSGGEYAASAIIQNVQKDAILYAQWTAKPMYTIVYDTNGGTGIMTSDSVMHGGDYTIKTNSFNRDDYFFTGWNTAADGSGDEYAASATIQNVQGNVVLYAQWNTNPMYSVAYDANGGTGTMVGDNVIQGNDYTVKTSSFNRDGYVFTSWNTAADGRGDEYAVGTTLQNMQEDVILYAQWKEAPYSVAYDANGGTGVMTSDGVMHGDDYVVKMNGFTREGYFFIGWNTAVNGSGDSYIAGSIIQNVQGDVILYAQWNTRKWTFLVYMAADNDLEPSAMADVNELETVAAFAEESDISVLVILDRAAGYDASNGNWTDTRFFEITGDSAGFNTTIVSKQLDCSELGLSTETQTELDMANPIVLSQSIAFAKRAYTADNYGLIIWGHGTGWRGEGENNQTLLNPPLKAVAFDDTAGSYMTMPSLDSAVSGKNLSVIGFDTCFGALIEVCYQIKDDAEWFIGSEGVTPASGWDYTALFTSFLNRSSPTASDFCDDVIEQFKNQYIGTNGSTISKINLTNMDNLFNVIESFSGELANSMTTSSARAFILDKILHTMDIFHYASFPSDMYVDIYSFTETIIANRSNISSNLSQQNAILSKGTVLQNALNETVTSTWSKKYGTARRQMGIHVIPLQSISVPVTSHETAYVKTGSGIDKSAFVEDSIHWVPNLTPQSGSFLDKLFYWTY